MYEDYDEYIAFHYQAFRPGLHAQVLLSCLGEKRFQQGLDVGCGTGQSSIALAPYCNAVFGIEPGKAMLAKAIHHPGVTYSEYDGTIFPMKHSEVDIVTFAGSLYYAKSQTLINEVVRVTRTTATILIYDFDICYKEILKTFKTNERDTPISKYNHKVDFSGLDHKDFRMLNKQEESTELRLNAKELAHLILANKEEHLWLDGIFGSKNLYQGVLNQLLETSKNEYFILPAKLYYTQYSYSKS